MLGLLLLALLLVVATRPGFRAVVVWLVEQFKGNAGGAGGPSWINTCPRCGGLFSGVHDTCPFCHGWRPAAADKPEKPPAASPTPEAAAVRGDGEPADLYTRILDDLERLKRRGEVLPPLYDDIKRFYSGLLVTQREQAELEARRAAVRELVSEARSLVTAGHAGGLERALALLEDGARRFPGEKALADVSSYVRGEIARREENARAAAAQRVAAPPAAKVPIAPPLVARPEPAAAPSRPTFEVDDERVPHAMERFVEAASQWSRFVKPFLLDNVGWFVGAFLVLAGFVVLITTFWRHIEENQVLMLSLVHLSLLGATGAFFALAYFMRLRHSQLEASSNVLLIVVALLIPLVFAAAAMVTLVPGASVIDPSAVIVGSALGLVTAVLCYIVTMLAAGLFARSFYRIHARVLVGISALMMAAPLLRWASPSALRANLILAGADYLVVAALGYGVVRFNREFLKRIYLERRLATWFTFGTLVGAALVALVILHDSALGPSSSGGIDWSHYAPFAMVLAALTFHTDAHLKDVLRSRRRVSRFTFVGYAVSIVALLLAVLPFAGSFFGAAGSAGLVEAERTFLQNFRCGQTLLLAILLYGALFWGLESVAPLYLALLAVIGEYHLLVTQWVVRSFGAASWALACLPLFVGLNELLGQAGRLQAARRRRQDARDGGAQDSDAGATELVAPFQVAVWSLGAVLLVVSLWARFAAPGTSPLWFAATLPAYAGYCGLAAVARRRPQLLYAGTFLLGLDALAGSFPAFGPAATLRLAALGALWAALVTAGERVAFKRDYRTPVLDAATVSAAVVLAIALCRRAVVLGGAGAYALGPVAPADGAALLLAALALAVAAGQYRSRLPTYASLLAVAAVAPNLSAAVGLAAWIGSTLGGRRRSVETGAAAAEEKLLLLGRFALPLEERRPDVWARPLAEGALPLSIAGLAISSWDVFFHNIPAMALLGLAVSAATLAGLTRDRRWPALYVTAILAGYLTIQAAAQKFWIAGLPEAEASVAHALVAAIVSLFAWSAAVAHAATCRGRMRGADGTEAEALRGRVRFHSDLLHASSLAVATGALLVVGAATRIADPAAGRVAVAAALVLATFFALSAAVHGSRLPAYPSLAALAAATVILAQILPLPWPVGPAQSVALALLGAVFGLISALLPRVAVERPQPRAFSVERSPLPMRAVGTGLWIEPLAELGVLLAGLSLLRTSLVGGGAWRGEALLPTLASLHLGAVACLLATRAHRLWPLYSAGLATLCFAVHAAVETLGLRGLPLDERLPRHALVAALLALSGWAIGSAYSTWCASRLRGASDAVAGEVRARREFYAGWLYHVTLALAAIGLIALLGESAAARLRGPGFPLPAASLLLTLFFGLSASTYRSRIVSSLAVAALGVFALDVAALVPGGADSADGAALASLALALATVAATLAARAGGDAQVRSAEDLREVWRQPLARGALVLSVIGVLLAVGRVDGAEPVLATLWLTAAVFLIEAWVERRAAFTYLAVAALAASMSPLLATLGRPQVDTPEFLAALAVVLWVVSFAVERGFGSLSRRLYVVPLAHGAAAIALAAVAHGLASWSLEGWPVARMPLAVACVAAMAVFLLSARTVLAAGQGEPAPGFVYAGCVSLTAAGLIATEGVFGVRGLAPATSLLSIGFAAAGLALAEAAGQRAGPAPMLQAYRRPIADVAVGLPVLAVWLALVEVDRLHAALGPLGLTLLATGPTYLLSVRSRREAVWLHPAVAFTSVGLLVLVQHAARLPFTWSLLAAALWMNVLAGIARLMRRHADRVGAMLRIPGAGCERPLLVWAALMTACIVAAQAVTVIPTMSGAIPPAAVLWAWPLVSGACVAAVLQLVYLEPRAEVAHLLVASTVSGSLWVAAASGWRVAPDLAVALLGLLWMVLGSGLSGGADLVERLGPTRNADERVRLAAVADRWASGLLAASLALTMPTLAWFDHAAGPAPVLFVAAVACAAGGMLRRAPERVASAATVFAAALWAAMAWSLRDVTAVVSFSGLTAILLTGPYLILSHVLIEEHEGAAGHGFGTEVGRQLAATSAMLSRLAAVVTVGAVMATPPSGPIALTIVLIASCWVYLAWRQGQELAVYGAEVALGAAYLYVRHALFGVPFGPDAEKAFAVVAASFALFGLNVVAARGDARAAVYVRPTYYTALVLPAALLLVTPFDERGSASLALFAAASFYLTVARAAGGSLARVAAAILLNAAIYLWVPVAHQRSGLLELYVIPAALTVLAFAHLHRGQLNRQALTAIRLAASAAILAVSTYGVFFEPSLPQFVTVLGLSLAGIAAGIALRVRPFVYVGLAFLIVNVVGQVGLQVHTQAGIARAVILITVGVAVMTMMVFFNAQREQILGRYRDFVADTRWE